MVKVNVISFNNFKRFFYSQKSGLRLGQAFLNTYFPAVADSALYYETSDEVAETIIFEKYIELE